MNSKKNDDNLKKENYQYEDYPNDNISNNDNKLQKDMNTKKENIADEKNGITNEVYYENLYEDLPQEVVELLLKTHPLLSEEEGRAMAEIYATKHTRKEDAELIKKLRSEQLRKELNEEIRNKENAIFVSEENTYETKEVSKELNKSNKSEEIRNMVEELTSVIPTETGEFESDKIQVVRHRPRNFNFSESDNEKKDIVHKLTENENKPVIEKKAVNNRSANKKPNNNSISKKPAKKPIPEGKKNAHENRNKNIDLKKFEKEKTLDAFFSDEVIEDDDKKIVIPGGKKVLICAAIVIVCVCGMLLRTVYMSAKLTKANAQLEELTEAKEENNKLKLDMLSLEEENSILKGEEVSSDKKPVEGTTDKPKDGGEIPSGEFDMYTVVSGDTIGGISQKIYGDFAKYKEILKANGLTEDASLKIGQKLKIPKL